jgi:hypothetical protein
LSRVLLEKLVVDVMAKIFSALHSVQMFATVPATASHCSLPKPKKSSPYAQALFT